MVAPTWLSFFLNIPLQWIILTMVMIMMANLTVNSLTLRIMWKLWRKNERDI